MSGRFRRNLVWTCLAAGALAFGAGCATDDAIEEGDFADDELIEEEEGVLDPGVGGAGDEGFYGEDEFYGDEGLYEDDGIIAPGDQDDGLFEQGEDGDEGVFEPGVGGAGDEGVIEDDKGLIENDEGAFDNDGLVDPGLGE